MQGRWRTCGRAERVGATREQLVGEGAHDFDVHIRGGLKHAREKSRAADRRAACDEIAAGERAFG
jgi:hypothetical protein